MSDAVPEGRDGNRVPDEYARQYWEWAAWELAQESEGWGDLDRHPEADYEEDFFDDSDDEYSSSTTDI